MSNSNFNIKLNIIKQMKFNNGCNLELRHKIVDKKTFRKTSQLVYPTHKGNDITFINLTHIGELVKNCKRKRTNIWSF